MANEKRLIDANAIQWEEHYVPDPNSDKPWDYKKELCVLKPSIYAMPTVDAVEVVRCKDCKHSACNPVKLTYACRHPSGLRGFVNEGYYFCSCGERREGE